MSEQEQHSASGDLAEQVANQKTLAARAAVQAIPDGAVIGLGSGTTVDAMLHELAARVRQGLRVTGIPASQHTASLATSLGIPLANLDEVSTLTTSIDGADEVTLPHLHLIKGGGGALLREKLIAASSQYRIIIVDSRKLVPALGSAHPVPVEVTPFGWHHTSTRLAALGCQPRLRTTAPASLPGEAVGQSGQAPYITDGGNYILDCHFGSISDPQALAIAIKTTTGVVDHGLFLGMTDRVYLSVDTGIQIYDRPS
ncbi:MAG: ribose 5-phosphate isomerase A [Chloroflexi bacterium]|nr:MAG: ribose 5-phosphate isomerase A [Chloroflexota bacterium]